jgi:hypothetical protein
VKKLIAPLAVLLLAGIAPLAQANIQIYYGLDSNAAIQANCTPSGATDTSCSGGGAFTVGGVIAVTGLTAHSNLNGTPSIALASSSNASIVNNDSISHTFNINIVASGYTLPVTNPALTFQSHISTTTFIAFAGSTFSFRSCVDGNNGAGPGPGPSAGSPTCPTGSTASAVLTPDISTTISSAKDAPVLLISSLGAPYALDETISIVLAAGESINFAGSTTLTPVPEPMSIALLGGVVILTSRLIRRKQNQAS